MSTEQASLLDVFKSVDPVVDLGHLMIEDLDPLDVQKTISEDVLLNLARDNAQILLNKVFQLPVQRDHDVLIAELPAPTARTPREKPIPTKAPKTKWERYADMKGIKKRRKSNMVWDEASQEWKPRWGYKRANDDTKDWLIEVPQNADPYEDQFEKRDAAKKERVAKNKFQNLKNIQRNMKKTGMQSESSNPNEIPVGSVRKSAQEIALQAHNAKHATASHGNFTEQLPGEKKAKKTGIKRKFESNEKDVRLEKDKHLNILKRLESKKDKIDVAKAVSQVNRDHSDGPQVNFDVSKPGRGRGKKTPGLEKPGKKEKGSKRSQRRRDNNKKQFKRKHSKG